MIKRIPPFSWGLYLLLPFLGLFLLLPSCKSDDDDDEKIIENGKELRPFTFSFAVEDAPEEGVAMICPDTHGDTVVWLQPIWYDDLQYESEDSASFSDDSYLTVSLFQPYHLLEGKSNALMRVNFNFQNQDGRLDTIKTKYTLGYKQIMAYCTVTKRKATVSFGGSFPLDPAQFILRLSLVDSVGEYTLADRLSKQADQLGLGFRITEIRIYDANSNSQFYDDYYWYLDDDIIYHASSANQYISLQDQEGDNMMEESLFKIDGRRGYENYKDSYNGTSWGTTCYAAIPYVSDDASQQMALQVRIAGDIGTRSFVYYGQLDKSMTYSAGKYYVTAPVKCYPSVKEIPTEGYAKVLEKTLPE